MSNDTQQVCPKYLEILQQVVDEFFQAAACSCLTPSMKVIP